MAQSSGQFSDEEHYPPRPATTGGHRARRRQRIDRTATFPADPAPGSSRGPNSTRRAEEAARTEAERRSWANFEGVPLSAGPELADIAAALAKSGARSAPMRTPPRASGKKLRRSLEEELEAERLPAKPNGWFTHGAPTESGAVGGEVAFDRALLGLAAEVDPWPPTNGPLRSPAQLAAVDYTDFRLVSACFRCWTQFVAESAAQRYEYERAVRNYKSALSHRQRDLVVRGWVSWEGFMRLKARKRAAVSQAQLWLLHRGMCQLAGNARRQRLKRRAARHLRRKTLHWMWR